MSKDFSLSIHLSQKTKERLDYMAQRIGVPREAIVEFAVEELLKDLNFEGLDSKGNDEAEGPPQGNGLSDRE